ncbi:MAG: competence/damage-inducible protein A, partial [Pseudomonadota bacterium]
LPMGEIVISKTIRVPKLREGDIAHRLGEIAKQFSSLGFGSYPWFSAEGYGVQLVVRGRDKELIAKANEELLAMLAPFNLDLILLD